MSGWDTALDAMIDLEHAFRTDEGLDFLTRYALKTMDGDMYDLVEQEYKHGRATEQEAVSWVRLAVASVEQAEPIWVSGDVVELIDAASQTFEPESIHPDDPFTDAGFALLERPLYVAAWDGSPAPLRAVSWLSTRHPSVANHVRATDGGRMVHGLVIGTFVHLDDVRDVRDGAREFPRSVGGSPLMLCNCNVLQYDDERPLAEVSARAQMRTLQVMWRLAKQDIARPRPEQPTRHARKRWARAGREPVSTIKVLRLRRIRPPREAGEDAGAHVEWSHRWWVNGHWRNQFYPSLGVHRQIWIHPYVKGPEEKALVAKGRAIEFTR